jgi:hypothetical protein
MISIGYHVGREDDGILAHLSTDRDFYPASQIDTLKREKAGGRKHASCLAAVVACYDAQP